MILNAGKTDEYKQNLTNVLKENDFHLSGKEDISQLERQLQRLKDKRKNQR